MQKKETPPKAKAPTKAELKKRIEDLEAQNTQLLNSIGELTGQYLNTLSEKENVEQPVAKGLAIGTLTNDSSLATVVVDEIISSITAIRMKHLI